MTRPTDLETLLADHQATKARETALRDERIWLEVAIADIIGVKATGQKTVREGRYKVTVKPNYSYSIDMEKWATLAAKFPAELHPFKLVLDESKIRAIGKNYPDLYFDLAIAVSVKPIKSSVFVVTEADQ